METIYIGMGATPSPFLLDFFASGRKLKIMCSGGATLESSKFSPLQLTGRNSVQNLGVAVTDDYVSNPEFTRWINTCFPIAQVSTVTCGMYESLLFWSMLLMWKHPHCEGYLLNPPADKHGGFRLDFPPWSDMRRLMRVVGFEEAKVDEALSKVARGQVTTSS